MTEKQRVVRVFISSTFRDMQAERDYLVKYTFPELRRRCRGRRVEFVEVDLRWGITREQSERGEVLPLCLREIENCRPFFISLLGERYGWVPESIDEKLVREQPWLAEHRERSVTELEILHGVLQNPQMQDRAFFYFRDPGYLKTLPPGERQEYEERPTPEEISKLGKTLAWRRARQRQQKLDALKDRLRHSKLRVREDFRQAKELGEWLLQDLWAAIDQEFPAISLGTEVQRQAAEHLAFAESRAKGYVPRDRYVDALDHYSRTGGPPLILVGDSGVGKTSLLANWALDYQKNHPEDGVILYFIGSTPQSTSYQACLQYLLEQLQGQFGLAETLPATDRDRRQALPRWLAQAARRRRLVLVLDGLNQLEDRDRAQELGWLPEQFPDKVRVFGSTLPGPSLEAVKRLGCRTLAVKGLQPRERLEVITRYLKIFGKDLEPAALKRLRQAPQTANPLYLRALLEEMRVFGLEEQLLERLNYYLEAPGVPELYDLILERLEETYNVDCEGLVQDALAFLWVAPRGLSERELRELLGSRPEPLPAAHWSPLYLALSESLVNRSGFLSFFHDYIRKAVQRRYLADPAEELHYHHRLADYFEVGFGQETHTSSYRQLSLDAAQAGLALAEACGRVEVRAQAHLYLAGALLSKAVSVSHENTRLFAQACEMARKACDIAKTSRSKAARQVLADGLLNRARFETGENPDFGNFAFIDRAIKLFQQCRDPEGERNALFERAVLAMRLGQWDLVEPALNEAQNIHAGLAEPDPLWQVHAFQVWGEYYAQRRDWQKAGQTLEGARHWYEAENYPGGVCAATGWLGIVKCHQGDTAAGLALVRQALQAERDSLESQEGVSKWLQLLGEFFWDLGERQRGLEALWLCEALREAQNHTELRTTRRTLTAARQADADFYERCLADFNPRANEFGEYAFLWGLGPFRKHPGNPILAPRGDGWESRAVFNPAAWTDGAKVYLLYRAEGPSTHPGREFCSRLGLAVSSDGFHFERHSEPVLEPTEPYEISGGCEDPRLVKLEDAYYLTYTAYDGETARLALAVSQDLSNWEKRGPLFTTAQLAGLEHAHPHSGWAKSGALLPEKINGFYWLLFGDTHIWAACSPDLHTWRITPRPVLSPRPGRFDSYLVEPGTPLMRLLDPGPPALEGIWLGYNGARQLDNGSLRYSFGQALLAPYDPTQVLRRSVRPLLEPTTAEEMHGQMPQVVFGTGLVLFKNRWLLYYGMADSCIGLATAQANI